MIVDYAKTHLNFNPKKKEDVLREEAKRPKLSRSVKEFYRSGTWLELRMKAILKYGRTCHCCGATGKVIHVDHIKPRSKYPKLALELDNLQILCVDCNLGKGAWDETDWRPKL